MKQFEKFMILIVALIAAGGLGYRFLPGFGPVKYILFAAAILIGGEVLCRIDKYISYKCRKK